ncbi:MAG TPA: hypothetical protein PKX79_03830 [Spirochaetota bacterium]|nr:hypothetical protein [Spirochaetota bacterium]HPP94497.1 hypothetical protein [Spirochaetota bacterium]HRS62390.1 hypothetical protein [Spirochaetota bacterium]HRU66371.1 hypothetical protein [Spirochaetota bacterium]
MNSTAAQIIVSIIPIVGIVMGSLIIFFYLLWNYKLKVEMIKKGIYNKTNFDIDTFSLLSGLLIFFVGLMLVLFFLIKDGFSYSVLSGLIPSAVGLSLLLFFIIRHKTKKS